MADYFDDVILRNGRKFCWGCDGDRQSDLLSLTKAVVYCGMEVHNRSPSPYRYSPVYWTPVKRGVLYLMNWTALSALSGILETAV